MKKSNVISLINGIVYWGEKEEADYVINLKDMTYTIKGEEECITIKCYEDSEDCIYLLDDENGNIFQTSTTLVDLGDIEVYQEDYIIENVVKLLIKTFDYTYFNKELNAYVPII